MMRDTRRMEGRQKNCEHWLSHIGMKVWALIVVISSLWTITVLIILSLHESHLDE